MSQADSADALVKRSRRDLPRQIGGQLARSVRAHPGRSLLSEIAIGVAVGLIAVAVRLALPLAPEQLPTLTVVVLLAIVTTFVGARAGITTAIVGGLLSWYFFFNAHSWSLANNAWIPLLGFTVIAAVIITTAHLYRSNARRSHEEELLRLEASAEQAHLFAREMAHRQKNTLAIVQSIAFQTIGSASATAAAFAGRLRALADANELLDEHVEKPAASVKRVIEAAIGPFESHGELFDIDSADEMISAQQVVSLALALHELATNAVKHGALSVPGGRVSLRVEDKGDQLQLTWKERGGPTVRPPRRSGFGTRLLSRSGMDPTIEFEADGLRCSMGLRKSVR